MDGRRRWALVAVVLAVASGAILLVALGSSAPTYRPSVIGVVRERVDDDGAHRVTLEDGRIVVVDPRTDRVVEGPAQPDRGHLLLVGTSPARWYATVRSDASCFWIGGRGVEDGEEIRFASGIVLPRAGEFDRAHYHSSEHEFNGAGFCVSAEGEVLAVR